MTNDSETVKIQRRHFRRRMENWIQKIYDHKSMNQIAQTSAQMMVVVVGKTWKCLLETKYHHLARTMCAAKVQTSSTNPVASENISKVKKLTVVRRPVSCVICTSSVVCVTFLSALFVRREDQIVAHMDCHPLLFFSSAHKTFFSSFQNFLYDFTVHCVKTLTNNKIC